MKTKSSTNRINTLLEDISDVAVALYRIYVKKEETYTSAEVLEHLRIYHSKKMDPRLRGDVGV